MSDILIIEGKGADTFKALIPSTWGCRNLCRYIAYYDFFFFFLISNGKYILKKNTAPYIGNVLDRQKHQETKLQWLNKIGREKQEKEGKTKHHSRRVKQKKDLNSRMDRSRPSKLLAFCSRQIHHIKQCGTILHITILRWRLKLHDQHSNKSTTLCGITQQIPNKQKTILHISKAKGH